MSQIKVRLIGGKNDGAKVDCSPAMEYIHMRSYRPNPILAVDTQTNERVQVMTQKEEYKIQRLITGEWVGIKVSS